MKFIQTVFLLSSLLTVSACWSSSEHQLKSVESLAPSEKLEAPTQLLLFDEISAQPVNCGMIEWLSELEYAGKATGVGCGFIDKNGLVKFTPEFMALEPMFKHQETTCYPLTRQASSDNKGFLGWYYVTEAGFARGHSETHDNNCVGWEYLPNVSKTYVSGNLAYMDKTLAIKHQTKFSFGEDFSENGLAIVCSKKPDKRLGPGKEHFAWHGGKCGQINLKFEIVTSIDQPYEKFNPLPEWAVPFYTRNANIKAKAGKGEELQIIMQEAFENLPGLKRVDVRRNVHDTDLVMIGERWDSRADHAASLKLPKVLTAIDKGRPLIEAIEHQSEYEYDPVNGKY